MSEESVSAPAAQVQRNFSALEELGRAFAKFINETHPLPNGVNFMTVRDEATGIVVDVKRKGPKVFVTKHKSRRAPRAPEALPQAE